MTPLSENDFDTVLKEQEIALVEFKANWCHPCKMMKKELEKILPSYSIPVYEVDMDEAPNIGKKFLIQGIPLLMVFRKGEVIAKHMGFATESKFKEFLDAALLAPVIKKSP